MSNPFARGRNSAYDLPCDTRTGRSTSMASTGESCSTMPAQSIRNTKSFAEPSRIGISGPSISSTALCTPQPASAARACSTVPTRASGRSGRPSTVHRRVSITWSNRAGMSTPAWPAASVRSVRRTTNPLPVGAGRSVSDTRWPPCRPTPTQDMAERRVRWAPNPCPAITGLICVASASDASAGVASARVAFDCAGSVVSRRNMCGSPSIARSSPRAVQAPV